MEGEVLISTIVVCLVNEKNQSGNMRELLSDVLKFDTFSVVYCLSSSNILPRLTVIEIANKCN